MVAMFILDSSHLVYFRNCMNLFHTPWYCFTVENLWILLNILSIGSLWMPKVIKACLIVSTREGRRRENWDEWLFPRLLSGTGEGTGKEGNVGGTGLWGWGTKRSLDNVELLESPGLWTDVALGPLEGGLLWAERRIGSPRDANPS